MRRKILRFKNCSINIDEIVWWSKFCNGMYPTQESSINTTAHSTSLNTSTIIGMILSLISVATDIRRATALFPKFLRSIDQSKTTYNVFFEGKMYKEIFKWLGKDRNTPAEIYFELYDPFKHIMNGNTFPLLLPDALTANSEVHTFPAKKHMSSMERGFKFRVN